MKIYESFEEIANDFTSGSSITHRTSKHKSSQCMIWQQGVQEFAKFLDRSGIKLKKYPKVHDNLWDNFISHKG